MITADGRPDTLKVRVTAGTKRVKGTKVRVFGAGVKKTSRSKANGIASVRINPRRPGLITITAVETKPAGLRPEAHRGRGSLPPAAHGLRPRSEPEGARQLRSPLAFWPTGGSGPGRAPTPDRRTRTRNCPVRRGSAGELVQRRTMKIERAARVATATAVVSPLALCLALTPVQDAGRRRPAGRPSGSSAQARSRGRTSRSARSRRRARGGSGSSSSSGRTSSRSTSSRSRRKNPKTGKPTWYRISLPGRPNGQTGWVRAAAVRIKPMKKRLVIDRGARRFQFWDGSRLVRTGQGRRRRAGGGDAHRPLLRAVEVRPQRADPRGVRVRDERVLEALRLAGRRRRRRPRDTVAGAPRPGRLARVRPAAQQRRQFLRTRVPLGMPIRIVE